MQQRCVLVRGGSEENTRRPQREAPGAAPRQARISPSGGIGEGRLGDMGNAIYEFKHCSVKHVRQLAEGGFSYVHLVQDSNTSTPRYYAMKSLLCQTHEQRMLAEREIGVLERLQHPFIVQLLGVIKRPHKEIPNALEYHLLFPYYPSSLFTLGAVYSERRALTLLYALCQALDYLHKAGLAHRDLKPHNCMLLADKHTLQLGMQDVEALDPILIDLGSAQPIPLHIHTRKEAMAHEEVVHEHSSAAYRSPELHRISAPTVLTASSDVFSLGCILYFMLCGHSPFERDEGPNVVALVAGQYDVDKAWVREVRDEEYPATSPLHNEDNNTADASSSSSPAPSSSPSAAALVEEASTVWPLTRAHWQAIAALDDKALHIKSTAPNKPTPTYAPAAIANESDAPIHAAPKALYSRHMLWLLSLMLRPDPAQRATLSRVMQCAVWLLQCAPQDTPPSTIPPPMHGTPAKAAMVPAAMTSASSSSPAMSARSPPQRADMVMIAADGEADFSAFVSASPTQQSAHGIMQQSTANDVGLSPALLRALWELSQPPSSSSTITTHTASSSIIYKVGARGSPHATLLRLTGDMGNLIYTRKKPLLSSAQYGAETSIPLSRVFELVRGQLTKKFSRLKGHHAWDSQHRSALSFSLLLKPPMLPGKEGQRGEYATAAQGDDADADADGSDDEQTELSVLGEYTLDFICGSRGQYEAWTGVLSALVHASREQLRALQAWRDRQTQMP